MWASNSAVAALAPHRCTPSPLAAATRQALWWRLTLVAAAALALATAVSIPMLFPSSMVLSELCFIALVLLILPALAFVWIVMGYAAFEVRGARGAWWSSSARANTAAIAPTVRWVATHTALGEIVAAADDESAVFLYAHRHALPIGSLTPQQYLTGYSEAVNAVVGPRPIVERYGVRTVVVGGKRSFDAAQYLVTRPTPLLVPRETFPGGAAFTVLSR
jgi:hypothetical protein